MATQIRIDEEVYNALVASFGKQTVKGKVEDLLVSALESRIEFLTREILKFEEKHGVSFEEFDARWDNNKIRDPHSHTIEGDFMDWEMLEMEKKELLSALARLKTARENGKP